MSVAAGIVDATAAKGLISTRLPMENTAEAASERELIS